MTEEDIKNIRFQKFSLLEEDVISVANSIKLENEGLFNSKDLIKLEKIALEIAERISADVDRAHMCTRFALACRRISEGESAYDEVLTDPTETRMLTFEPGEHIPTAD